MSQFWVNQLTNERTIKQTNKQRWNHRTYPVKAVGPIKATRDFTQRLCTVRDIYMSLQLFQKFRFLFAIATHIKTYVRYFHQTFIFSPNDSPSKTLKNAFYFI